MTHICVSKLTIIGSDNGLSPDRRQAIIWTNAGILLIGPLGANFSEISIEIQTFSFKKMRLKVSSAKRRPFCLGLNMLKSKGMLIFTVDGEVLCSVCPMKYTHVYFVFLWLDHWNVHFKNYACKFGIEILTLTNIMQLNENNTKPHANPMGYTDISHKIHGDVLEFPARIFQDN